MDNNGIVERSRKDAARRGCDGRHSGTAVAFFSLRTCCVCDRRACFEPTLKCSACKSVFHRRCLDKDSVTLDGWSSVRKNDQEKPAKAARDDRCPPKPVTHPVDRVHVSTQTDPIVRPDRARSRREGAHDGKASHGVRNDSVERNTDSVMRKLYRYLNRQNEEKRLLEMNIVALNKIVDSKNRWIKELEEQNKNHKNSKLLVIDLRKCK